MTNKEELNSAYTRVKQARDDGELSCVDASCKLWMLNRELRHCRIREIEGMIAKETDESKKSDLKMELAKMQIT